MKRSQLPKFLVTLPAIFPKRISITPPRACSLSLHMTPLLRPLTCYLISVRGGRELAPSRPLLPSRRRRNWPFVDLPAPLCSPPPRAQPQTGRRRHHFPCTSRNPNCRARRGVISVSLLLAGWQRRVLYGRTDCTPAPLHNGAVFAALALRGGDSGGGSVVAAQRQRRQRWRRRRMGPPAAPEVRAPLRT